MNNPDRLYELLPAVYRTRDAEKEQALRALLRVIAEQIDVVEDDIERLYENWFIETCDDWVVPYIGDLIGHRLMHEAGEPGDVRSAQGRALDRILIPRREVAQTIASRRRKGTLALLEVLANDVAGWPAGAVEFYQRLGAAQPLNQLRILRDRAIDVRSTGALALLDGPFDRLSHTVDVRRIDSHRSRGRHNIGSVGLFVWRLRAYRVKHTPAACLEENGPECYAFSALGNDTRLFTRAKPEPDPAHLAEEMNVPAPIGLRQLKKRTANYYGKEKSLAIWAPKWLRKQEGPIPVSAIIVADLSEWGFRPPRDHVVVDPELGRIAFPPEQHPPKGVWVTYYYGFSADIGGGEYRRPRLEHVEPKRYYAHVGEIGKALAQWRNDNPPHAVIELVESGVYAEQIDIDLPADRTLQLRAAAGTRPIIRLLDWQTNLPDSLHVSAGPGSEIIFDGLLITGRSMQIRSAPPDDAKGKKPRPRACDEVHVVIRHCTLVPGWGLGCDCEPNRPAEPSLELYNLEARVRIEHSIVGSIQVQQDQVRADPLELHISDSIVDATSIDREALGAPSSVAAHAILTIERCTVFGQIQTHAISLAENCIFAGRVCVARRQIGCVRFSYVTPGSRTPRRYECQPDRAETAAEESLRAGAAKKNEPPPPDMEMQAARSRERLRVRPQFNSVRYGNPTYCQLSNSCPEEITRGADDESEMGVFHDLFQPQRAANLNARLDEFTPAGTDAGVIFAT
jgi:hypothetical protein